MSTFLFIQVILYTFTLVLVSQLFQWILVLRTDKYRQTKSTVTRMTAQVDLLKSSKKSDKKATMKQILLLDKQLNTLRLSLSGLQLRGGLVSALLMLVSFSLLNSLFAHQIITRLPFEPFVSIRGIVRRGIPDQSHSLDCGATFIYILSSIIFRHFATKLFPNDVIKGPSIWDQAIKFADKMID